MTHITEEEIRPSVLMDKQRILALVDAGRMLSKYEQFVEVNCPACGSDKQTFKYEKNSLRYVDCENCETFYINPRPTPEVLEWFYKDSPNYAYWNDVIFPASEDARREKVFSPRVDCLIELCKKYQVQTNSILEIGAGFGTFCSEIKKRNKFERIVAIEPTPGLAKTCRERGLDVIELPVEKVDLSQSELFDIIASFEVIEHLFEPSKFIADAEKLLRPGGLIILTCPNGNGFDVEVLGNISTTVDHEHLNYFNPESLGILLTKHNFEVLESFTPGRLDAELVRNKVLSNEFDISGNPFLKRVLIDEWDAAGQDFQNFLVQQGLSSNMWIVAKKR